MTNESKSTKEEWKDVKGWEGIYQISNKGRLKSLARTVKGRWNCDLIVEEKIREASIDTKGYGVFSLCNQGYRLSKSAHRLVAEHFIPNPKSLPEVNHIDEKPSNNDVDNLEWCTRKYNCNHGTRNERIVSSKHYKVYQYDRELNFINEFNCIQDAVASGDFAISSIQNVLRGDVEHNKGFVWSKEKLH